MSTPENIFTDPPSNFSVTRLEKLIEKHRMPLILISIAFILFALAAIIMFQSNKKVEIITPSQNANLNTPEILSKQIKVDVSGAVLSPGVHETAGGSRVRDVLVLAGGLSNEADRDWFDKNINQAAQVRDGQKIYIKKIEDKSPGTLGVSSDNSIGGELEVESSSLININEASQQQLESLPGIGPVTAEKIISGRPYNTIEDLVTKKVVTKKVFEKIKGRIATY